MNNHPKYGISCDNNRRDNSYKKRQRLYKIIKRHVRKSYVWKAGYYMDTFTNTHYKYYSYNSRKARHIGEKKIRHYNHDHLGSKPSFYKRIWDYYWEVV